MNELLTEVAPRLLGFIRLRLGRDLRRDLESQDLLQATLIKAFLRLDQFEGSGTGSLLGWMTAIANNEIRDQYDFHRRHRRDAAMRVSLGSGLERLEAEIVSEVSRIHLKQKELELERALDSLDPLHREVILLRKYEELSYPESGQRLGKSPDAARMLLARAMTALSRALGEST